MFIHSFSQYVAMCVHIYVWVTVVLYLDLCHNFQIKTRVTVVAGIQRKQFSVLSLY